MKESVWMMWDPVDAKRLIWVYINNTRGGMSCSSKNFVGANGGVQVYKVLS